MLLKPYGQIIEPTPDPYRQSHVGRVVDNNDPDKLKRVKVILDIWENRTNEELPWVKQQGNGQVGASPNETDHYIPELGAEVRVTFPNGDPDDPQYSGMEATTENKCTAFDEDYPNTYGKKDSLGNIEMTNKKTGIKVIKYSSGLMQQIDPDGKMMFKAAKNPSATLEFDENGNLTWKGPIFEVHADDKITLNSSSIELIAQQGINTKAQQISLQADAEVGINTALTNITSMNSTNIRGGITNIAKLSVTSGGSALVPDLITKRMLEFSNGILQGELGG